MLILCYLDYMAATHCVALGGADCVEKASKDSTPIRHSRANSVVQVINLLQGEVLHLLALQHRLLPTFLVMILNVFCI